MADLTRRLALLRVPLGFLSGALALWQAEPTTASLLQGGLLACAGEALRIWAAGHLNKSREVTSSGPYRWFAHPLYVGSSIMGAGLAVASRSVVVTAIIGLYLGVTITAAIANEEAFLRRTFGDAYTRYRGARPGSGAAAAGGPRRRFSVAQVLANREYRAVAGLLAVGLLLLLKATL